MKNNDTVRNVEAYLSNEAMSESESVCRGGRTAENMNT